MKSYVNQLLLPLMTGHVASMYWPPHITRPEAHWFLVRQGID
jgi:hypothetical protein